jgi:hypothetical protein
MYLVISCPNTVYNCFASLLLFSQHTTRVTSSILIFNHLTNTDLREPPPTWKLWRHYWWQILNKYKDGDRTLFPENWKINVERKHWCLKLKHTQMYNTFPKVNHNIVNPPQLIEADLVLMALKNSVLTAQKTQHFSITEMNWAVPFKEITTIYAENYTNP